MKDGHYKTIKCLPEGFSTGKATTVVLYRGKPFTARSISYKSEGYGKGAQSIVNEPCDPQEEFCGNNFILQPPIGELEVSDDGVTWHVVATLPSCYRMHSLQRSFTASFPAVTASYFRLNLHDWNPVGKGSRNDCMLKLSNIELSEKAATYRWEERAAYCSEYIRPTKTPSYKGDEVINKDRILNISQYLNKDGEMDWTAPEGSDWMVLRIMYAPTRGHTKHGRKNLMGLECDKLNAAAAELHWNNYTQVIIDSLSDIGCRPWGVCMDSHEAGSQNWTADFPQLFREKCGYDIIPWLPAMQGYIVSSVDETEQFLQDLRRTIADGINERYLSTLQRMATDAGVHFTAQATGNGQSICSDNIAAKGRVEIPQGEFWARMHDGSYDIKEAASAAHLYGGSVASAEAFTDFRYNHIPGTMKDEADMAAVFQVNDLVVCASEAQPFMAPDSINTGDNRDYALNRKNTMWPLTNGFWDYQGRNNYMMRQGHPIVDILVYAGDDAPMKMLAHRLPVIPEGYDFDVCTTDALKNAVTLENKKLIGRSGCPYRLLVIEKSAVVRPDMEQLIADWKSKGLPVYDNRQQADDAMSEVLKDAAIKPDIAIRSRRSATDRVFFTHRQTQDTDIYFLVNHSKDHVFDDDIVLRTPYAEAEWWDAVTGSRYRITGSHSDDGLLLHLRLCPDEAGFIVVHGGHAAGLPIYDPLPQETITPVGGQWTLTFDSPFGGPKHPIRITELTDWSESEDPELRYFSGLAMYENIFNVNSVKDKRTLVRIPGLHGVARIRINGMDGGIVWCTPWETDITSLVRPGENKLQIEVRNSLANRLIGDANIPETERRIWTYTPLYSEKDKLVPSGIIGDVLVVQQIKK